MPLVRALDLCTMVEIYRYAIAKELFPNQPGGFPLEEFDPQDLILPEGENFGIDSDDDDADEEDVESESGFGSVIVVGNLPVVPAEKFDKLVAVIRKIYSHIGSIREGGMIMPVDETTNLSKGFAFIEFANPQEALAARQQTSGYKLDKNHTFVVNMFDDFEKYAKVSETYSEPEVKPYTPTENLHSWMLDKSGRDQLVLRAGKDTIVAWNDGKRARMDQVHSREFWTESFVQWSPMGNYLTTVHRQGVAVWGGPEFTRLARFAHPNVRLLQYSPNEKYLVTYSSQEPNNPRESATVTFSIFEVRTGKKLRVFEGSADDYAAGSSGGALKWPVFKWSGGKEDNFFARMGKNAISVYQAPDMGLLDKKTLKVDGVQDFEWSPSEDMLACVTQEQNNLPARIALIKLPERTEVRQKNLFSVSDAKIYWHPQGDYLAVKVDRFTKTKKSIFTGFELFSIRDRDIPMEVLELPVKSDKIVTFSWEPKGHRFAIVHGEGARPSVSFYSMRDDKGRLGCNLKGTLTGKSCNSIFWSPQGKNIVLAGLKNLNGQLEFFNVDEMETMAAAEHFACTDIDWDPTGRYVASSITTVHQMENGFNMWSFHGRLLYPTPKDQLFQFSWRPRLPSLLPVDKEAEIAKNLKQYSKRYDEEDEALLMQADADVLKERATAMQEWEAWKLSKQEAVAIIQGFRKQMFGAKAAEKDFKMECVVVEQVVEVKEEPYNR
eukprot:gene8193-1455_t